MIFKTRDVVSAPGRLMRITTIYNVTGFRYDPAEINDQSQMPRRLWSVSAARLRLRDLRATSLPQKRGAGHLALVPFSSLFGAQFRQAIYHIKALDLYFHTDNVARLLFMI